MCIINFENKEYNFVREPGRTRNLTTSEFFEHLNKKEMKIKVKQNC